MNAKINYAGFIDMFFTPGDDEMPDRIFSEPQVALHSPGTGSVSVNDTPATVAGIKPLATPAIK